MDNRKKIKLARNNLLAALNDAYPARIKSQTIYRTMIDLDPHGYSHDLLNRDLAYLADKGYVRVIDNYGTTLYILSAEGKEIADDLINDPALEI